MNPISYNIPEPIRIFPEPKNVQPEEEWKEPIPSIPYGWEDTKDWSWR